MDLWHTTLDPIPKAPDYNDPKAWALNPHLDSSHKLQKPRGFSQRVQGDESGRHEMAAEVFFIHPTMLLEGPAWNADLEDKGMNESVDAWPIRLARHRHSRVQVGFLPRDTGRPMCASSVLGDSLSWAAAEIAYQDREGGVP